MCAGNRAFLLFSVCIGLSMPACQRDVSQAPAASAPKKSLSKEEIRAKRQKLEADLLALKTEIASLRDSFIELGSSTNSQDLIHAIYHVPPPEERAAIHEGNLIRVQIDEVSSDLESTLRKLSSLQSDPSASKNSKTSSEAEALQTQYRSLVLNKTQLEVQLDASVKRLSEIRAGFSTSPALVGLKSEIEQKERLRETMQSELDELRQLSVN